MYSGNAYFNSVTDILLPVSHIKGFWEQNGQENIWTWEGSSDGMLEKA
jgi:hypothetical protein